MLITLLGAKNVERNLSSMETKIENTAQENVTSNTKKVYSFTNLTSLNISISLLNTMVKEVIITSEDYQKARDVIVSNHGLKISTIMA